MNGGQSSSDWKNALRALRYKNYRLYFAGQGISIIGTWMQSIALSWYVYRLTNSPFLLGILAFASQIPTFLVTPVAGVLTDRLNRHRILVATQSLALIQATVLTILVLTDTAQIWHLIALSIFIGLINAFDIPTRQSFTIEIVENREDLPNAIALNSSLLNGGRLFGPAIGGILIAAVGEGMCFLINAVSYLAVLWALFAMKVRPDERPRQNTNILQGMKEGFSYAFGFPPIRSIILFVALMSLAGMPYQVLLPVYAKDILHGDSGTQGLLMAAAGVGALCGSVYLAQRKSVLGLGKVIAVSAGIFGVGIILFANSRIIWLSILLMVISGFGIITQMASSNTVLQTVVEDDKRGRIMSLYTMAFMGMAPFGSLIAGSIAGKIGASLTFMIYGAICIAGALFFGSQLKHLRPHVHPIYRKLGIIPEIASGMNNTGIVTEPKK